MLPTATMRRLKLCTGLQVDAYRLYVMFVETRYDLRIVISFDGEYLARIMQRFGFAVIRGSSSSGGSEALATLTKSMQDGHAASLTVDGPRGPRYESKIGAIILAKRTGNPVVPVIVESKRHRRMNSWDRLQIPFPFSPALALFGEPIYVDQDANQTEIDAKHRELQDSLDALVEHGREWRESR